MRQTSRWRSFAINCLTVLGSIAFTLLALEVVFRFLPVATAPWVQPATAANPIQRYAANTPYTWSVGWNFHVVAHGRTNVQGFVAGYDYDATATTPLVAVVGDSFIEAMAVPFQDSVTGRLQQALGARGRAYSFAQSGAPLSQYIAYARHACDLYRPERLVFVVVGNDFDESIYAKRQRNGFFHLHPKPGGGFDFKLSPVPPMSVAERVARNSALALYFFRNIARSGFGGLLAVGRAQADDRRVGPYVGNTSADAGVARVAEGEQVIEWFLGQLASLCMKPDAIVIAVDAMRPEVYDPARLEPARESYFGRMRTKLLGDAAARGFLTVDLEEAFGKSFAKDQRRFEPPIDNHWNEHGHEVAAAAIVARLADWQPLSTAAR
jgi:hypothetical protein